MKNKIFLLTALFLFYNLDLFSQCAMCKAVVESNLETGSQIGKGLNNGILYLMAVPYIAIFSFAIFWYFQNKKYKHS